MTTFAEAPGWSRAVIKVGSHLVAPDRRGCSTAHLLGIAQFVHRSREQGRDVVIVSSGAVAAGLAAVPNAPDPGHLTIAQKQAFAAIGQSRLMQHWSRLFDVPCAQVLLTYDDVQRRSRYVNAQNTLNELLSMGVLPIVNENDTVATEELKVGDNDNLAAYVAVLAGADLLIICSDVDGLYDADPRTTPNAQFLPVVDQIDARVFAMAGGAPRGVSTGGMRTKVEAADKATSRGIDTVLVNGTKPEALGALLSGTVRGTLFRKSDAPLSARKHWMLHAVPASGTVTVDAGAAAALQERGASLLPSGITRVDGDFAQGDAVEIIRDPGESGDTERSDSGHVAHEGEPQVRIIGKGITQYGASDLRRIRGRQSHELPDVLGDTTAADVVIHRDDLVLRG
jgi:glutamate 5-kinase